MRGKEEKGNKDRWEEKEGVLGWGDGEGRKRGMEGDERK